MDVCLNRADIEWLLVMSEQSKQRVQLDVRGADMQGIALDHLDFSYARMERTRLIRADLTGSILVGTSLQEADLTEACLKQANVREANLAGATLYETLMDADTHLEKVVLSDAKTGCSCVENTRWEGVNLTVLDWTHLPILGDEERAHTKRTFLRYRAAVRANRQIANALREQGLNEEADNYSYRGQRLKRDILMLNVLRAVVQQPDFRWVIRPVFYLHRKRRYQMLVASLLMLWCSLLAPSLFDVQSRFGLFWGSAGILTLVLGAVFVLLRPILQLVAMLLLPIYIVVVLLAFTWVVQVEFSSLNHASSSGVVFDTLITLTPFAVLITFLFAVLAKRQGTFARVLDLLGRRGDLLYAMLQSYFRLLSRTLAGCGRIAFSQFLDKLAGYGYKPGRSVLWYLVVVLSFAFLYALEGGIPLFPDAIVFSIASFHGRGFFPSLVQTVTLHHPLVVLASLEAVVGLLIEISFIATFTQRFFGR